MSLETASGWPLGFLVSRGDVEHAENFSRRDVSCERFRFEAEHFELYQQDNDGILKLDLLPTSHRILIIARGYAQFSAAPATPRDKFTPLETREDCKRERIPVE